MCVTRPECQNCTTCGKRVWQFWVDTEMHPPGCPEGAVAPQSCRRCIDTANNLEELRAHGIVMSERQNFHLRMMGRSVDA